MQKIMKPLLLLSTAAIVMACSLSLSQQQDATPSSVPTASLAPATDTAPAVVGTDTAVPEPTATPVRGAVPRFLRQRQPQYSRRPRRGHHEHHRHRY